MQRVSVGKHRTGRPIVARLEAMLAAATQQCVLGECCGTSWVVASRKVTAIRTSPQSGHTPLAHRCIPRMTACQAIFDLRFVPPLADVCRCLLHRKGKNKGNVSGGVP
jgi:hypothetical protein